MADQNTSLPIRTESNGDAAVKIVDGTITSQQLGVDSSGKITVKLDDGSGTAITSQTNGSQQALDVGINVAGVQIDPRSIRALTSADVVTANQGSANTATNGWPVKPTDGTNSQSFTAAGEAKVSVTQPLPAGSNTIGTVNAKLDDGAGNAITSSTAGSTRPLDVALRDSSGSLYTAANPLPVTVTAGVPGTEVNNYNTASAIAAGATSNHTYTITTSKTFKIDKIWASASGKLKIEVQTSPDGSVFTTKWVAFNSTATPNIDIYLGTFTISDSGTGSAIKIIRTNLDKQAMDVYSTLSGVEV